MGGGFLYVDSGDLKYRDPNGNVIDLDGAATSTLTKYSTGWQNSIDAVTVANGSTHTVNHGLGTEDITVDVYAATDNTGSNAVLVTGMQQSQTDAPRRDTGAFVNITDSNNIEVLLGSQGLLKPNPGGTYNAEIDDYGTGTNDYSHIKVVVIG